MRSTTIHEARRKPFDHILVRHEQAATHAAEGYARVSGEVGVALVTSGPGATNTLTGVADAMMDSTPIVVIAGQVAIGALGTDAFQEVDLVGVAQPISKWSYQIRHAEDVAWAVSRAFYIARSGRPGPVVLDFPKNAQVEEIDWEPKKVDFVRSYVASPKLDEEAVRQAAELINNAKRPLALVGQGVELGNAQEELKAFLEKADIPAGRTMLGLSALPSNHPLNVGMLGMHGNYAVNLKEQECDVLIAIGMRFSDRVTGNVKTYAKQAKIIHLDIDRSEIDKNVKTDVAVVADCKESLPAITALLNKNDHQEWRDSFKELDEKEREKVIEPAIHPTDGPLLMGEVVNAVAEEAPDDTVLVTDVGQNQLFATRYFKYHQKRSICTSGGLGTMGYGMPAAIGATFATRPHRVLLHGRRRFPDVHRGAGHHHGAAGSCEDDSAEQQLSGQRAPVAGHVLDAPQVVHQDDEPLLRAHCPGLRHPLRCRHRPQGTGCCRREDAHHRRPVHPRVCHQGGGQRAADDTAGHECRRHDAGNLMLE